ncbi:hypothetical protein [Methanosarcina sp. 2.H.A.1B.4]|nr:hypothetical protein [Methanosarcina sp. 2.H.A.1B.4]
MYVFSLIPASRSLAITGSTPIGGMGNWTRASNSPLPVSSQTA